ncbi:MAG: hypothetical protein U1F34_04885 [Gammaproteobacteria bacterium]
MDPKAQMHRFIDKDLRAVDVPNHGVVITRKLAEILGASVGQNLAIDVLSAGKRLKREVPIVGVIDELTGWRVYEPGGSGAIASGSRHDFGSLSCY